MSTQPANPLQRVRRGCLVLGAIAVLAVAACSSGGGQQRTGNERAASYNAQLGMAYLHQGDLALAKEKLERALAQNPRDPSVHSALALLFESLGNPAKADAEFRTALQLAPRDPDVLNNYAVYLCRSGRTDEGVRHFEEAAHNALYRTPEAAYTNAGVCLRAAKRDEEARKNFRQALQLRPNFAEAAFQLGDLEFQRGKLTDARAQIDTFLGSFEATPDLLLLGVRVTRAQGDRMAAERFARRLRVDFPGSDQARTLAELDRNRG